MQSAKKIKVTMTPVRGVEKELEHLYARRSTIDSLIESLEAYDRYRAHNSDQRRRKSA